MDVQLCLEAEICPNEHIFYNITKFKTEKILGVSELEHGLNLDKGQV